MLVIGQCNRTVCVLLVIGQYASFTLAVVLYFVKETVVFIHEDV